MPAYGGIDTSCEQRHIEPGECSGYHGAMLTRWICAAICAALLLVVLEPAASAQPGTSYVAPPPQPLQLRLSDDDLAILDRGEISAGAYVGGGLLGSYFGFGVGHMVQGRWQAKGWIFTLGEAAAATALVAGLLSCAVSGSQQSNTGVRSPWADDDECPEALVIGAALAFGGLRLWEIVDLWVGPSIHNQRFRKLQRTHQPGRYRFAIAPTGRGSGVASLSLSF